MRLAAVLAVVVFAGCWASHGGDGHGASDGGPRPDGFSEAGSVRDGAVADGPAGDADVLADGGDGSETCRVRCELDLDHAAVIEVADWMQYEIVAAAPGPSGRLYVLLGTHSSVAGPLGRAWQLVTLRLVGSAAAATPEAWRPPAGPAELGYGLEASLLRARGSDVEAMVLFTRQERDDEDTTFHAAHVRWRDHGLGMIEAADLGAIAGPARGWEAVPSRWAATAFELGDGQVVTAVVLDGRLEIARLSWGDDSPSILDRASLGEVAGERPGVAALSGGLLPDGSWAFAGGGNSTLDVRPPFVATVGAHGELWRVPLGGELADPPPLLAPGTGGATVFQWRQNPADVDDSELFAARLSPSSISTDFRVATPRLPLPLDAHVGTWSGRTYALWSVRAPDDFDDTLTRLVLLDPDLGCGTPPVAVARFRGAAAMPSVYAAPDGDDLLVLGFPLGPSGSRELTALRVRCTVEPAE